MAVSVKQGDTLELLCVRRDNSDNPVSLSSTSVKSQMIKGSNPLVDLTVTVTDSANGEFTLSKTAAETDVLEIGQYQCDIQFTTDSGVVTSTNTFTITIVEDITSAES